MRPARFCMAACLALALATGCDARRGSTVPGVVSQLALGAGGAGGTPGEVAFLTRRCGSAVPAVVAELARAPSGGGSPDALAQVLVDCPAPRGATGQRVADELLAYVRGPAVPTWGQYLPKALGKDVPADRLRAILPGLASGAAALVAQALALDPQGLFDLLVAVQHQPAAAGVVQSAQTLPPATVEAWLSSPELTDQGVRVKLMGDLWWRPKADVAAWLRSAAPAEADPAVAELMWSELYRVAGDPAALAGLNRVADAHGALRLPPGSPDPWDWQVLRPAVQADPSGLLARGVAAYETVEGGRPYFAVDRCPDPAAPCWPFLSGDAQYDPAREIPGWQAFLRQYPTHPAAADAAYRLARCEEILGRWRDALRDMRLAADVYPDGQIAPEARGRLVFMLDVEIPDTALQALAADPPAPELAADLRYGWALRELRRGEFRQAAADLQRNPPPAEPIYPWVEWPLAAKAGQQRQEAAEIAAAARAAFPGGYDPEPAGTALFAAPPAIGDPAAAYRVAQILFHDDLALYNDLWYGHQQSFYAFDGAVNALAAGDFQPPWLVQVRGMNTYVAAEPIFAAVAADHAAPSALRAKAAYSAAECLVHLDGYNQLTMQTLPQGALQSEIVAAFRAFAEHYPHNGTLTADALLTVARYTRDPADVAIVRQRFPNSWQAAAATDAGKGPATVVPPWPGTWAYQRVEAGGVLPGSGTGSAPGSDGWTTIRLAPAGLAPGTGVTIYRVLDLGPGRARIVWGVDRGENTTGLPWVQPAPVAVIRVPALLDDVTFARQNSPW
jgi:tetratricopeptide (TPR) repeat protein